MEELSGRTAVVTGGASGIGFALARRFGAEGANLVIADVELAALAAAEAELADAGYPVLALTCDVRRPEQVESVAVAAEHRFGAVHLVCNNAGVAATGRVEELSVEAWSWVLDVNLWGVIHGCRTFVPRLAAHGEPAHIVNTASMAGLDSGPLMAPYFVSKFGVVALSESLWHEQRLAGSAIGVSVLCPGFVRTRIADPARNAPPGVRDWVTPGSEAGAAFAAVLRSGVEGGKPPAEIADTVWQAVQADRFWILPHAAEGSLDTVRARADAIVDGRQPNQRWSPPGDDDRSA